MGNFVHSLRPLSGVIAVLALICGFADSASAGARMTQIRHSVRGETTRIVLDLSGKVSYKAYDVSDPDRVAINLPGVSAIRSLKATSISDGVVRRIRINRLSWGAQVVLDLRRAATFRDFRLAPVDNMPNRIVIDVDGGASTTVASTPPTPTRTKPAKTTASTEKRPVRIAIDAGHGGHDPGALGRRGAQEKIIALQMSRRIVRMINKIDGYEAFLTRDSDVFLDLAQRTEIARKKGAHIFVSIHLNTAPSKSARGSEVFFVRPSGAQATANKLLKDRSKAAEHLGLEKPSSDAIMHMLVDVNQKGMMQRSSSLAEEILKAMDRKGLPPTRKVKQKSFVVLKTISMPSVLVETGFLTNSRDHKILTSDSGKGSHFARGDGRHHGLHEKVSAADQRDRPPHRAPRAQR